MRSFKVVPTFNGQCKSCGKFLFDGSDKCAECFGRDVIQPVLDNAKAKAIPNSHRQRSVKVKVNRVGDSPWWDF